jgi:hypothetical protein
MPFYYRTSPTADVTISGSANTSVDHLRTLTVGRDVTITKLDLTGKGQALATITGIEGRLSRFGTASTGGGAITPNPSNPDAPAATLTAFTAPTIGTTEKIQWAGGMNAAGQGAFQAIDPLADDGVVLANGGGANGNCDVISQSEGTVALPCKYTLWHREL